MNTAITKRQAALLLAGLIVAAPACAATAEDTASVEASAEELKTSSIYSSKEYTIATFNYDETRRESVKTFVKAKLRITVAKAGKKGEDYQYDGNGVMAFEFKIEWIDTKGDSINSEGDTYYAKATGKKDEFRLFDCASTNSCFDDNASSKALVTISRDERSMTISGLRRSYDDEKNAGGIVLDEAVGGSVTLTLGK